MRKVCSFTGTSVAFEPVGSSSVGSIITSLPSWISTWPSPHGFEYLPTYFCHSGRAFSGADGGFTTLVIAGATHWKARSTGLSTDPGYGRPSSALVRTITATFSFG